MAGEPYLEGVEFVKWSNNLGFVNKEEYSTSLFAFVHYTWEITNHSMMVVDVQGVRKKVYFLVMYSNKMFKQHIIRLY